MTKPLRFHAFIWKIDPPIAAPIGRWQYSDGVSSGGGCNSEDGAWKQVFHMARSVGADEVLVTFSEPAPIDESMQS